MSDTTTPITFLDLHLDLREVAMLLEALDTEIQDPLKVLAHVEPDEDPKDPG
jgi:hypothetical protein